MNTSLRIFTVIFMLLSADTFAGEDTAPRCGWFQNPTPGNAWLSDKDGEWIIGTQGGHQADGDWPQFKDSQWVKTNVHYGYGCACMRLIANPDTKEVGLIISARAVSLKQCRKDRALKKPN